MSFAEAGRGGAVTIRVQNGSGTPRVLGAGWRGRKRGSLSVGFHPGSPDQAAVRSAASARQDLGSLGIVSGGVPLVAGSPNKSFRDEDAGHLPQEDIRGQRARGVGQLDISMTTSRTRVLTVILTATPHGLEAAATAPGEHPHATSRAGKGAGSSLGLFTGAKHPFPEAPGRPLTSHGPELGHVPLPKPEGDERRRGHVCASADRGSPTSGRGGMGAGAGVGPLG